MYVTILSNLKIGALFHVISTDRSPIYVKDHYDMTSKKSYYHRYDNQKEFHSKGDKIVYVSDLSDLRIKSLATDVLTD